jgi:plastocyanin
VSVATAPAGTAAAKTAVQIQGFDNRWSDRFVVVAVGGTVTWTWSGTAEVHNVYLFPPLDVTSGKPATAGTFSFTFAKAGTYRYWCEMHHDEMTASVTVR